MQWLMGTMDSDIRVVVCEGIAWGHHIGAQGQV